MDPTGFTIGVVSLVGLVSTCIQAFQILHSVRAFSRDAELLFIKLDIERELFTQWAQQVGLLKKHQIDRRLFDKRTDLLIYRVLNEIKTLLNDATKIEGKYGETPIGLHYEGKGRRYDGDNRQGSKKVGLGRKFIWTVHGKEELKGLIDELGYFIGKLNQMIPSVEQRRATRKDLTEAGADVSALFLAEARTDGGYDDGDWSDLASEVATKAGEWVNITDRRRRDHRGDDGRKSERSRRRSEEYELEKHRRRPSVDHQPHVSSSSYRSSTSTLVEMIGDVVGRNPRPGSSFR